MPVEIGQLEINARVTPEDNGARPTNAPVASSSMEQQEELIERCVLQMLRVLEDRQER